jgi:hypothetical protein
MTDAMFRFCPIPLHLDSEDYRTNYIESNYNNGLEYISNNYTTKYNCLFLSDLEFTSYVFIRPVRGLVLHFRCSLNLLLIVLHEH